VLFTLHEHFDAGDNQERPEHVDQGMEASEQRCSGENHSGA